MPVDTISADDLADQVAHLRVLTKSASYDVREQAEGQLAELHRMVEAGLLKVGPKGYVHGWIYVGPPSSGSRVLHPEHGQGQVTRAGSRTVGVQFDSGAYHAFEHAPGGKAGEHFTSRAEHRAAARSAPTPAPARASADVHHHLDEAYAAINAGRHADAVNHLLAAHSESGDPDVRRKVDAMRTALAGRVMGVGKPKAPKVPKPRPVKAPSAPKVNPADTVARVSDAKTRDAANQIIAGHRRQDLAAALDQAGLSYRRNDKKDQLRHLLVQGLVGRRLDFEVMRRVGGDPHHQ